MSGEYVAKLLDRYGMKNYNPVQTTGSTTTKMIEIPVLGSRPSTMRTPFRPLLNLAPARRQDIQTNQGRRGNGCTAWSPENNVGLMHLLPTKKKPPSLSGKFYVLAEVSPSGVATVSQLRRKNGCFRQRSSGALQCFTTLPGVTTLHRSVA